jgi:hypothetical protein
MKSRFITIIMASALTVAVVITKMAQAQNMSPPFGVQM